MDQFIIGLIIGSAVTVIALWVIPDLITNKKVDDDDDLVRKNYPE